MPKLSAKDRPKNAASAQNAKGKRVTLRGAVTARGRNTIMQAKLDRRSQAGKAYIAETVALAAHLGGADQLTHPQAAMVELAARLRLLATVAYAELTKAQSLTRGDRAHPAIDIFLKASREHRATLVALGLERKTKQVPDLNEYLRHAAIEHAPAEGAGGDDEHN